MKPHDPPPPPNATDAFEQTLLDAAGTAPVAAPSSSAKSSAREAKEKALLTIGQVGRYALKYEIGKGGIGTVYAAHDPLLSRMIAIKTLHLDIAPEQRKSFNAMFINEARAAAGLAHPNIVTVFDAGVREGHAYIAMALLKGRDLRHLIAEGWKPPAAQAAVLIARVADALAYAHRQGVLHLDIKPANIFIVDHGQPCVLDFGIARFVHRGETPQQPGVAAGSPCYMSPEQVRQQPLDQRSDVFSLGAALYELLTGAKPFNGDTLEQITGAVLTHEPPAAHLVNPEVPLALSAWVARAMHKDAAQRVESAAAMARELRRQFADPAAASSATTTPATSSPLARHGLKAAAGVAALAVVGLVGASWIGKMPPTDAPSMVDDTVVSTLDTSAEDAPALPSPAVADAAMVATTAAAAVSPPPQTALPDKTLPPKVKPSANERDSARKAAQKSAAASASVAVPQGKVRLAISPWGQVEVNGRPRGTVPPINELLLPEGRHQITIRNADFPPYSAYVQVSGDQPVTIKHKFGS